MHQRIAGRRRRLTQVKLDTIAERVEDLVRSLLAVAGETCSAEALELAAVYCSIGMSLRSGKMEEAELRPFLNHFQDAITELSQIFANLELRELQTKSLETLVALQEKKRASSRPEQRTRDECRRILANGFDQVNRQKHLVRRLRESHRDDVRATDLLDEMQRGFLLLSESCTLMKRSADQGLERAGTWSQRTVSVHRT